MPQKTKVVWGAPCSGKSTFCKENIGTKDIVYDYDQLARAVTYTNKQLLSQFDHVKEIVVGFRYSMINKLLNDSDIDTAWLIKCYPDDNFKKQIEPLNPEYIEMEATKEECYERLEADEERPDKDEWKEKIDTWFYNYKERSVLLVKDREYRNLSLPLAPATNQKRFDSDFYIEGYATTFSRYLLYEWDGVQYYEVISPDALDGADMSDVIFQYDHRGKVLARQSNGTLGIEADSKGLFVYADLSKSTAAKELYEEIDAGLVTKMSWAFSILEESYNKDTHTWTIRKIKRVYDVSAVSIPANNDTDISARCIERRNFIASQQGLERRGLQERLLLLKLKMEV